MYETKKFLMLLDVLYTQSYHVYFLSVSVYDFKLDEFIQLRPNSKNR
jgi:hypothetical protein